MARFWIRSRTNTTTLTRASTIETLRQGAVAIRDQFKSGGANDIGATGAFIQWVGTALEVIVERDNMAAVSADIAALRTTVRTGLLAAQISGQAFISEAVANDIDVIEQSSVASTVGASWAPSHASSSAPTADNDSADTAALGKTFGVGSLWLNPSGRTMVCRDATPGAAKWPRLNQLTDWVTDAPELPDTGWFDALTVGGDIAITAGPTLTGGGLMFGTTGNAGTHYAGILRNIAAGDFRVGFSIDIERSGTSNPINQNENGWCGAVFVEAQADVANSNNYNVGMGWGSTAFFAPAVNGARSSVSGTDRWGSFVVNNTAGGFAWGTFDVLFERSGTTLNSYMARRGGVFTFCQTYTVSTAAGMIGIKCGMHAYTMAYRIYLRALDPALAAIPYRT